MALPNQIVPAYPDVPRAPGVPALTRFNTAANQAIIVASDAVQLLRLLEGPQWGIFDADGLPLIIGDSVVGVAFKKEWRVADFPIEKGSFASYNKVETPFDARLSFTKGGSDVERAAFLKLVQQTTAALDLVSVAMPEFTYESANVTHFDFERKAKNGVSLLTVDVFLDEVRVTASTAFTESQTQAPSGASPTDGGQVQPASPTAPQAAAAAAAPADPAPTAQAPADPPGEAP